MFYENVFRNLNKEKVKYLIIGGIAVNLYGFSRVTGDLDLMIDLEDSHSVKGFVNVIKKLGFKPNVPVKIEDFANPLKREKWIKEKNMKVFSVYNPANEIEHVDVMLKNFINFDKAYRTRKIIQAGNLKLHVVSIDGLIKLKKISGRERDRIDISALKEIKVIKDEKNNKQKNEMYDLNDIKAYMKMTAKEKLNWLEETTKFLQKVMPDSSKKIWEKLKQRGF